MITTQKAIRKLFRSGNKHLDFKKQKDGQFKTDTRLAFIVYIDWLHACGRITEKMLYKVYLK